MKKLICLLMAIGLFAGLTACKGEDTEIEKLTVSEVTHSIFYAPMYVAVNNGYFEKRGIEIELVNAGGADKVMTALLTGGADIGFAGPEAVVYVYAEGKEDYPKVFAQLTACDGSFLIGREDNPDFRWEDLKGSTILPGRKGGIPYMTLLYSLNKNGLEVGRDVFFDEGISYDAMTGAFLSGTGDYVTVFEPGASAIEAQGKGKILASVGEEGGAVPYTTYFANSVFLNKNPDLVQRFTDAIYEGQKFVWENSPKEVAEAIKYAFPDTEDEILVRVIERYKEIGAYSQNPVMEEEAFNRLCDILKNAGELEKDVPFSAIIDNSFAKRAIN